MQPDNATQPITFEPLYGTVHIVITAFLLGFIIVGTIVGNMFVVAAILLDRNLQRVSNYLIFSLAVADLMVATLVMPISILNEVSEKWWLGLVLCDFWVVMDVLCCTASILHLVAIAIDRYWAITSLHYVRSRTTKPVLVMIVLVWIIALAISLPTRFHLSREGPTVQVLVEGVCGINEEYGFTIFSTVGAFYLPMGFIIAVYLKIYHTARVRIRKRKFRSSKISNSCPPRSTESSWRMQLSLLLRNSLRTQHVQNKISSKSRGLQQSPGSTEQADQSCIYSDRTTSFMETEDVTDRSSKQSTPYDVSPVHCHCNHGCRFSDGAVRCILDESAICTCIEKDAVLELKHALQLKQSSEVRRYNSNQQTHTFPESATANNLDTSLTDNNNNNSSSETSQHQFDSITIQNSNGSLASSHCATLTVAPGLLKEEDRSASCSESSGLDPAPARVSTVDFFLWQNSREVFAQLDYETLVVRSEQDCRSQLASFPKCLMTNNDMLNSSPALFPPSPFIFDSSESITSGSSVTSTARYRNIQTTQSKFLSEVTEPSNNIFPCSPYLYSSQSTPEFHSDQQLPLTSDAIPPDISGTLSDLSSVRSYADPVNPLLNDNTKSGNNSSNKTISNSTYGECNKNTHSPVWNCPMGTTLQREKANILERDVLTVSISHDKVAKSVVSIPTADRNGSLVHQLPIRLDNTAAKTPHCEVKSPGGAQMITSTIQSISIIQPHNKPHNNNKANHIGGLPLDRQLVQAEQNRERLESIRERKAAITVAIITGCFILCWLPFFVRALVTPFCKPACLMPRWADSFFLWLGYLNSSLNPILYTVFSPEFRAAFKKIVYGRIHTRSSG